MVDLRTVLRALKDTEFSASHPYMSFMRCPSCSGYKRTHSVQKRWFPGYNIGHFPNCDLKKLIEEIEEELLKE